MNPDAPSPDDAGAADPGPDTGAEAGIDVDGLPVRLVFVAGETEVAVRDLQRLAPGYVFDLRQPVDRHVEVRANGRTVARGELVEVDGRVGVRVLECTPAP